MVDLERYSILPPIEEKIFRRRIPRFSWLSIIGAPGTLKTIACIYATYNWLRNNVENGYTAIYIPTENDGETIKQQALALGMNLEPFLKKGYLLILDKYFFNKGNEKGSYTNIPHDVMAMRDGFIKKFGAKTRTLLVIDSVSAFWEKMPAMSRSIWSLIQTGTKNNVDLAIVTLQLSVGSNKGFGFGAEHGADAILRVGSMIEDGEGKRWIYADKTRIMNASHAMYYWGIDHKKLFVGDRVNIKGKYADPIEAIEGLKYQTSNEIQMERNEILEKKLNEIYLSVERLVGSIMMICRMLEKNTGDDEGKNT